MVRKHAKKITTNSKLYLALSGIIATYGFIKSDVTALAFAMWMIQTANYFKSEKKTDVDGECEEPTILGECDVHHH